MGEEWLIKHMVPVGNFSPVSLGTLGDRVEHTLKLFQEGFLFTGSPQ